MQVSRRVWNKYIGALRKVNDRAAAEMTAFLNARDWMNSYAVRQECVNFGYALATKYGEAAGELACEMYDAVAATAKRLVPAAEPAATATYSETAKSVIGTMKTGNTETVAGSVGRLVKMAGVDTTMQNAIRDHAEWAWIPSGDSCAFCEVLASQGWLPASKAQMDGDHAEHIHANCDCTFAIRFDENTDVAGYEPEKYRELYDNAEGNSSQAKINSIRRENYAKNKEEINEQKRSAYAKRQELNSSRAEEGSA